MYSSITTTTTGNATLATIPVTAGTTKMVIVYLTVFCSAGTRLNESMAQRIMFSVKNLSGVITNTAFNNNGNGTITTSLAISDDGSGNALVIIGGIATSTIRWNAYIEVYDES
jgi:hypothetical protein